MGTAKGMVDTAAKSLGMAGRPNAITRAYAAKHGNAFLKAPWCDMAVTEWAHRSDNAKAVLPGGDRAYTVWHAEDFKKGARWTVGDTTGVNSAKPGWIVFFDWGGTNSIGAIDHVGVVVRALGGGRVETIEGNTGDACKRRIRAASVIAGFGRPSFDGAPAPSGSAKLSVPNGTPALRNGSRGSAVSMLQKCLNHAGLSPNPDLVVDGDFGPRTENAVRLLQRTAKITADGIYGEKSEAALRRRVA